MFTINITVNEFWWMFSCSTVQAQNNFVQLHQKGRESAAVCVWVWWKVLCFGCWIGQRMIQAGRILIFASGCSVLFEEMAKWCLVKKNKRFFKPVTWHHPEPYMQLTVMKLLQLWDEVNNWALIYSFEPYWSLLLIPCADGGSRLPLRPDEGFASVCVEEAAFAQKPKLVSLTWIKSCALQLVPADCFLCAK